MAGAEDVRTLALILPGDLPLQDGSEHAIVVGNPVPGRLGMPRGFGDSIEKCAGPNGLLRSGEDHGLRCRQVVRQELQHCVRREVEKPAGVDCRICWMTGRRRMVPLRISRRLADVRRERCDVDERRNPLVTVRPA